MRLERITGAMEAGSPLRIEVDGTDGKWTVRSWRNGKPYLTVSESQLRRAMDRFLSWNLASILQRKILQQNGRCALCGGQGGPMEADHIVKRSKERNDREDNIRAVHSATGCGLHAKRHGLPQWSAKFAETRTRTRTSND